MRTLIKLVPLALFGGAVVVQQACGSIPNDTGPDEFPVAGVIRGSVVYNGPPPCTQNGEVVGNAIIFVFDRANPPPPSGVATTAVNFGVVSGDVLFGSIPRTAGATKVCPAADAANVFASAPYIIAPMAAGSYVVQSFYDYTGNFLPTFDFRKLPESSDVGGGYIDLGDANKLVPDLTQPQISVLPPDGGAASSQYPLGPQSANPNYQPVFLPVNVGNVVAAADPKSLRGVPTFALPPEGYIADNVTAFIGSKLPFARPYFYPEGVNPINTGIYDLTGALTGTIGSFPSNPVSTAANGPSSIVSGGISTAPPATPVKTPANPSGAADYAPVLSYPQDLAVFALPTPAAVGAIPYFQASFPQLDLHWMGNANNTAEQAVATDTTSVANPFHMQFLPSQGGNGGIFVFHNQTDTATTLDFTIPEGTVPTLWPLVVLLKLEDDPSHTNDPQSLTVQGSDNTKPIVIVQAITISQDSLLNTVQTDPPGIVPSAANLSDHVTALLRPAALCIDPRHADLGGTVVTPFQSGPFPPDDTKQSGNGTIFDPTIISNPQLSSLVKQDGTGAVYGCLPTGRYQINVVYPTSQAWTTPNQTGSCAAAEGTTSDKADPGTCTTKPRPVLRSQGTRAVVEITPSTRGNCKIPTINAFSGADAGTIALGPVAPDDAVPVVPTVCTTLVGN